MFIFILETYNISAIRHGIFPRNPTPRHRVTRNRAPDTGTYSREVVVTLSMNSVVVDSIAAVCILYYFLLVASGSHVLLSVAHYFPRVFFRYFVVRRHSMCRELFLVRKCFLANCVLFFYTQVQ